MFNCEKFKQLRKNYNMLQSNIASKLNVSVSTVGMWEQGRNQPDNETIKKIANIFNVTTDYLLDNDINSNNDNKELLETISTDLSDPLNKALYSKASELKNAKDKQIVLNIIESFIKGVNDEK